MKLIDKVNILNQLVGSMLDDTAESILRNSDCFLYPQVSLFIPSSGQCKYAITPSHCHPAYSFIYYFQPVSNFIIEGNELSYDLSDGKCLSAISPDIPHQEVEQDHFQSYIAIMIHADIFHKIILQYTDQIPIFKGEAFIPHPDLLGVLRCFMLEANDSEKGKTELINHLAQVITHLISRSVISRTNKMLPLYDRFEVDKAIAYMNSHYSEKISLEDLAEQVHRSTGHFSKIFKTVTNMTPIDFLQMIRLQKARIMILNSTKTITEIAIECGFSSSSYFSFCFMDRYHMTPTAFKQNFQQSSENIEF